MYRANYEKINSFYINSARLAINIGPLVIKDETRHLQDGNNKGKLNLAWRDTEK